MLVAEEHHNSWTLITCGILSILFLMKTRVMTIHAVTLSTYTVSFVTFALKFGTKQVTKHVVSALLKSLPISTHLLFRTGQVTVYAFTWSSYTVAYVTCVVYDGTKHVTKHMTTALCRTIPYSSKLLHKTGHVTGLVTIYAYSCSTSTVYTIGVQLPLYIMYILARFLYIAIGLVFNLCWTLRISTLFKWLLGFPIKLIDRYISHEDIDSNKEINTKVIYQFV